MMANPDQRLRPVISGATLCIAAVLMLGAKCFAPKAVTADAGSTDAGFDAGTTGDAGQCGEQCNTNPQAGEVITIYQVKENSPTPMGGPITGGQYVLTQWQTWMGMKAGAGQNTLQESLLINQTPNGQTMEMVTSQGACGTDPSHQTFALATSGATLTMTETCPAAGSPTTTPYTAGFSDGGLPELILFGTLAGETYTQTFTGQ